MGNCDEFRQNVRSGGIKTALTEIHLAGVFRSLQSINLYFRHMAHKKVERTDGKYLQQITYIEPSSKNAKKCTINS